MIDRAPVHGLLAVLQAGLNNQPIDVALYESTKRAVSTGVEGKGSLRRVLTGAQPTTEDRKSFHYLIANARDFVSLTQDSSTITEARRDAAIATLNVLLTAGQAQEAFDQEAAKLVARANPELFSADPLGNAAVALYAIGTMLQSQKRMMQVIRGGVMGMEREIKGLPSGSAAALEEAHRLQGKVNEVQDASGKGTAERFFRKHSLDEEHSI